MTPEPDSWEILAAEMRKRQGQWMGAQVGGDVIRAWAARVEELGRRSEADKPILASASACSAN